MSSGTLTPTPYQTVLDQNGNPLSGARITTYLAGTSTLATTYTDVGLSVANANPILADSAGRYVAYLSPGSSYKFVITDSGGTAVKTQDNVSATPASSSSLDVTGTAGEALTAGQAVYLSDGSGSKTAGSYYKADSANTYSSSLPQVGMVPASIASGASGTIRLSGSVTGLSSLVVGTSYFIGTAGALTSTAPTNRRYLGVADSTSSLVLSGDPGVLAQLPTLTANALVIGGGAGVSPSTDSNWTITSQHFLNSATQPRCVAYNNAVQSVTNNTETALTFNSEDLDVGAMHDTVSNTSRMTIPTGGDGLYWIRGATLFGANATGQRYLKLKKNGTTDLRYTEITPAAGSNSAFEVSGLFTLVAGDYLELQAYQNSGGNMNIGSATRSQSSELAAVKLW